MTGSELLASRLADVRSRLLAAARRGGRDPAAITLVGASKTVPPEQLRAAWQLGLTDFGENRARELRAKQAALAGLPLRWHFIGRLQTNKVRDVVGHVVLIHSLDRWSLAEAIDARARALGLRQDCLLQVNISGEASKGGLPPREVADFARRAALLPGVRIVGLMAIPAPTADPEQARPAFRALRALAEALRRDGVPGVEMAHLSMGMSGDMEVAIEEGATLVRVGTAIFGERPPQRR